MARKGTYDVIVLDVNLPDIGGFEVAQRLRATGNLTKPFSHDTLVAHVRALQRRGEMDPRRVLRFGDVEMDLTSR